MSAVLPLFERKTFRSWKLMSDGVENVPGMRFLPEPTGRTRWLTRDEAQRLLVELPEHLKAMARFTLATGLREANVTGLQWSQIDMQRRCAWINADQAKGKKAIAVPLNADALEVIRGQIEASSQGIYLQRNAGKRCEW